MATAASGRPSADGVAATRAVALTLVRGAVAGVGASLMMAMYAMVAAATYLHTGFFTPLYHIAATFVSPDTMMASMQSAMAGNTFTFALGPAVSGAMIHMMVGAMYGTIFAVVAHYLKWSGALLVGAGTLWGFVVFAVSTWIALPLAAALFGGGDPIADMAGRVGYPTFLVEHLLFGAALGMLLLRTARNRR